METNSTCGTAGLLYCYNMTTGALEWTYGNGDTPDNDTAAGLNAPWPNYPIYVGSIADGKVYCFNWEHSPNVPFYKGYCVSAIDAYTGKLVWNISCWTSATGSFSSPGFGIADGYLLLNNNYDSQFYCIGRGPSQTTVEAPMSAVQVGSNIVIQGTVMDIATGTKQNEQAADFPNGVPCVSDSSETAWMEYVYMQKPFPTDTTGVPVTISVIDSNNNQRIIGTTTSDASGTYALNWAPDIAGNYTIIANFAGTNSYWPSSAETHAYANEATPIQAPTVTAQANVATTSDLMIYMVGGVIAIIIAIAIVGILMLRKRA